MTCCNCDKYKAVVKDYREIDGCIGSTAVCKYCFNLGNKSYFKVAKLKLDPKRVLNDCEGEDCSECEDRLICLTEGDQYGRKHINNNYDIVSSLDICLGEKTNKRGGIKMNLLKSVIEDVLNAREIILIDLHKSGLTLNDINRKDMVDMIYNELNREDYEN